MTPDDDRIAATILELIAARGPDKSGVRKSICPSEAARRMDPDNWRALMPAVRRVSADLAAHGKIEGAQKGRAIDIATARGPIRLRAPDGPSPD